MAWMLASQGCFAGIDQCLILQTSISAQPLMELEQLERIRGCRENLCEQRIGVQRDWSDQRIELVVRNHDTAPSAGDACPCASAASTTAAHVLPGAMTMAQDTANSVRMHRWASLHIHDRSLCESPGATYAVARKQPEDLPRKARAHARNAVDAMRRETGNDECCDPSSPAVGALRRGRVGPTVTARHTGWPANTKGLAGLVGRWVVISGDHRSGVARSFSLRAVLISWTLKYGRGRNKISVTGADKSKFA